MEKCAMSYDPKTKTVYIDTERKNFLPKYLYYVLQLHNIPTDSKVYFKGEKKKDAKPLEI